MLALQGAKYNIPVRLWLPETFPYAAPLAFVEPTQDMMIMHNHPFVNASGAVATDYLRQWSPRCCLSTCTLADDGSLCQRSSLPSLYVHASACAGLLMWHLLMLGLSLQLCAGGLVPGHDDRLWAEPPAVCAPSWQCAPTCAHAFRATCVQLFSSEPPAQVRELRLPAGLMLIA